MDKEKISLEFRLKKIDATKNCLLEEINHKIRNKKNYKIVRRFSNYFESLFFFVSAVGLKICEITARIKKYKSIIKK